MKPVLNASWYDDRVAGRERHDVKGTLIVTLKWSPWHSSGNELLAGTSLVLQASVARNESSVRDRAFTVWDAGPALQVAYGRVPFKPPLRRLPPE